MERSVSITDSATTTGEVPYHRDAQSGMVFVPAGSSLTSLTFHVAPKGGGTFLPLYDAGSAVALTVVQGRAYQLPSTLRGCAAFRMVGSHAGTVEVSFHL
jgi:hypothetical protein